MSDLVTSPIDSAKQFLTDSYFTGTPSDAALLSFNEQFIVELNGDYAKVSHPMIADTISIRVTYTRGYRY